MEKLIELLNEYASEDFNWCIIDGKIFDKEDWCGVTMNVEMGVYIISKQFGFIKWLVENDKIDREQFYDKAEKIITDFDLKGEYEGACNEIIMLLSISDTPIEDLISYLK